MARALVVLLPSLALYERRTFLVQAFLAQVAFLGGVPPERGTTWTTRRTIG
jgi:hypothetical protein